MNLGKEAFGRALACACCAAIGTWSALEISASVVPFGQYFWLLGALFGGIIAYVLVSLRQICSGVARSYRMGKENVARACHSTVVWRPKKLYWKAQFAVRAGYVMISITFALFLFGANFAWNFFERSLTISLPFLAIGIVSLLLFCWAVISAVFGVRLSVRRWWDNRQRGETYEQWLKRQKEFGWWMCKYGNPIGALFLLSCLLLKLVEYLWVNKGKIARAFFSPIVFLAKESWRFVLRALYYSRSSQGTLCFIDVTFGTISGFFFGSVIVGAVGGALLSIIDYQVISVWWLKLAPAKAKQ